MVLNNACLQTLAYALKYTNLEVSCLITCKQCFLSVDVQVQLRFLLRKRWPFLPQTPGFPCCECETVQAVKS